MAAGLRAGLKIQVVGRIEELEEAKVQGLHYPEEIGPADATLASLDAPTKSCGRRLQQAE